MNIGISQYTDKIKPLKRGVFTILICCYRKGGFGHLITFTIKALTNTDVPDRLAQFYTFCINSFEIKLPKGH